MGTLVGKLSSTVQTMWYNHRVTLPDLSAREEGHAFQLWLYKQGDTVTLQRLTILATELSHGTLAPNLPPPPPAAVVRQQTVPSSWSPRQLVPSRRFSQRSSKWWRQVPKLCGELWGGRGSSHDIEGDGAGPSHRHHHGLLPLEALQGEDEEQQVSGGEDPEEDRDKHDKGRHLRGLQGGDAEGVCKSRRLRHHHRGDGAVGWAGPLPHPLPRP